MAETNSGEQSRTGPSWTLRLAGPQDDSDESLWAAHSRASGYGPAELRNMVSRTRGLTATVFVAVFVPAAAWIWTLRPSYEATARIALRADAGAELLPPPAMKGEVEKMLSKKTLRQLVDRLDLAQGEEQANRTVARIEKNLSVGSVPETGVITIQYAGEDPEQSADVVNTLAGLYLDRTESLRRAAETRAAGNDELKALEQEMQRARQELAEFRQHNQGALLSTQREAARNRSEQLSADIKRLDGQLREAERRLDVARLSAQGARSRQLLQAETQVASLRAQREAIVEQLRSAEGRRSQLERLTARNAELEAAVSAAEENYIQYEDEDAGEGAGAAERVIEASLAQRAMPQAVAADGLKQPTLLLLSVLTAASAAVSAAVLADPGQRPVSHVADIATATGLPVLMMIEETQSHVS